jgi:alpha-galactosidase
MRKTDSDYKAVRRLTDQWREVGPYYLGDYYPLTTYSLENDVWMAFQFDRPDLGEGVVLAFRRPESVYESARFKLQGLDPKAEYSVRNLDAGDAVKVSGKELCETGLQVVLKNQPDSAVITYKRL